MRNVSFAGDDPPRGNAGLPGGLPPLPVPPLPGGMALSSSSLPPLGQADLAPTAPRGGGGGLRLSPRGAEDDEQPLAAASRRQG